MKKVLLIMIVAIACSFNTMAQTQNKALNSNKKLVAYFSCTGTTKSAAEKLSEIINADLFEIKPEKLYTSADLNWNDKQSRSSVEMHDKSSRPAIANKVVNMNQYETVFIGFPIWWNLAPTIVNTFIESYSLEGKTIVLFATSGGSGIENSEKELSETYPKLTFAKGKLLNGRIDANLVTDWINQIK